MPGPAAADPDTVSTATPALDLGWRHRAIDLACVLVPTALSAVLVLHGLGSRDLWVDEGATFSYASQHGAALWHAVIGDAGNMMAYYAAMHVVMELFGTSPDVLRLPSAICTVATVPVCFALVKRLFDRRAATLSALLVAASVPLVYWGQMARAYAPAVLLVSASTLAFVVALQTGRRAAWACYCVFSVLAIYCILLTGLVVVAQYCSLALRRRQDLPVARLVASIATIASLSVPIAVIGLVRGDSRLDWLPATGPPLDAANQYLVKFVASAEQGGVASGGEVRLVVLGMLAAWLLAACLFAVCVARRHRCDESFAWGLLLGTFLLPALATYAISELIHPVLSDRYLLSVVAPASMVAGVACSRIRPAAGAWLAGQALVGLRIVQITPTYGVSLEDWQAATSYVLGRTQPHDCAAFFIADGYMVFDYYLLRDERPHETLPDPVLPDSPWSTKQPYVLDPATIPRAQLPRIVASCPRLWLVETHQAGQRPGSGVPLFQVEKFHGYNLLMREIRPSYLPVSQRTYTGVKVVLYVREPAAGT